MDEVLIDKVNRFVVSKAIEYLDVNRIYLFGSRARGDYRSTSDFDYAIDTNNSNHNQWVFFSNIIRDGAPTLCGIDLVDLSADIDSKLRTNIFREGKIIYEKTTAKKT